MVPKLYRLSMLSASLFWGAWRRNKQRPQSQRPRQRNRNRVEAFFVVTRLIFQRALYGHVLLAAKRCLGLSGAFENQLLHQSERLLKYPHTLIQGLKEIDLRWGIPQREDSYLRMGLDR